MGSGLWVGHAKKVPAQVPSRGTLVPGLLSKESYNQALENRLTGAVGVGFFGDDPERPGLCLVEDTSDVLPDQTDANKLKAKD